MTARLYVGDVFDRMAHLEPGAYDLIITSPPFLALRSYLPDGHPDKAKEIGSEATPATFLDVLLALTAEWGRLLAPHGSIAIEIGDTYSGSGGGGGDYYENGLRAGQPGFTGSASASRDALREANARHWREKNADRDAWPLAKSLAMIPELYAASLAYGRNLLTGAESPAGRWRVRNFKSWFRSNPPVGALGDKDRPATSYITVATRAVDRYFDLDSARTGGSARATGMAVPRIADAHVVPTTLLTGRRSTPRGWCHPGQSKVAVGSAVTWETKRLEVVEPVGFLVGVEKSVGPQVMDLEAAGTPAVLASVPVTVEGLLAGTVPVSSAVLRPPSVPTGVVLASDVDAPPLTGTLESAKVVCQDLALVAGDLLAARITLDLDGTCRTAFAVAPIAPPTHSDESISQYLAGAPPLDWWHTVDATIDAEIDQHRAGEPYSFDHGPKASTTRPRLGRAEGVRPGARGVHIRRALERAGILATVDALDVSPKGYAGMTRPTTRLVPCGPHDGGLRTTSRGCPLHGDRAAQAPTGPDGGRAETPTTHTPHNGDHPARAQHDDSVPTGHQTEPPTEVPSSGSPPQPYVPAAKPHSTAANRTDPAPSTSPADTPSEETTGRTEHTSASPSSIAPDPDTPSNRTGEDDPPSPELGTDDGSSHTLDPLAACTCSYHHAVKDDESTSHYAVWPPELVRLLINEMCPRRVCTTCGKPSRRVTHESTPLRDHHPAFAAMLREHRTAAGMTQRDVDAIFGHNGMCSHWERQIRDERSQPAYPTPDQWRTLRAELAITTDEFDDLVDGYRHWQDRDLDPDYQAAIDRTRADGFYASTGNDGKARVGINGRSTTSAHRTLGWSDCGHDTWRPGHILDPFAGSGTTLAVATGMGRTADGIDLDERNADLARDRVGMFLEVIDRPTEDVVA